MRTLVRPVGRERPPTRRLFLLSVVIGVSLFAVLEASARAALAWMGPGPVPLEVGWGGAGNDGEDKLRDKLYAPDRDLFFKLQPGVRLGTTKNPRIFDVRTNAIGLRGPEVSSTKPEGVYRVLCVGDSCTFGSGVGDEDTYPAQLQRVLAERFSERTFEVLNAGVPGYTSHQGLAFLECVGFDLQPDAVVFTLGFNDTFAATAGHKRRFEEGRILPDHEYAKALAPRPVLGIVRLARRLARGEVAPAEAAQEQPAGPEILRVPPDRYRYNLEEVARVSRKAGVHLLLVAWPLLDQTREQADERDDPTAFAPFFPLYQDIAKGAAESTGTPFLNLVPIVRGRGDVYVDPVHMNAEGYGIVARSVATRLEADITDD